MTLTVNYWLIKRVTPLLLIGLALGQDCTASDDTPGITLMGECYSIENTTAIDRSWENLPGTISPGIGLLTNLTYLNLCCNQLTEDIPSEIGNLINLTYMDLHWNQLTVIPPEIGNLINLTHLDLKMAVTGPHTGDAIPPEMGNLTNLTYLDLSDNELGCHDYDWLGDWQTDNCNQHCDDTDECTAAIPPEIGNLTNLEALFLSDNHLSGEIPSSIGNLVNLRSLGLKENDLSGSIPQEIGNLTQLHVLDLKLNQLTGDIPSTIGNMTNLGVWDAEWYNPSMGGPGGQEADYWPAFDLSYNQLGCYEYDSECEPSSYYNSSNCCITHCIDTDACTGEIPPQIGNLTDLEYVILPFNQLTGPIPPEMGDMTSLHYLDLRYNQLNGEIPEELGDLSNMGMMWLYSNNLRGEIPDELCNIDVCGLDCNNSDNVFGGNYFCPPVPDCFPDYMIEGIGEYCNSYPDCPGGYTPIADPPPINGGRIYDGWCFYQSDLDNLQDFIDVNASLSGEQPIEIGEQNWMDWPDSYGRLSRLDFSNETNEITTIPESIGNLDELEVVDFSNTQITTIPASLGNLSELKSLSAEGGQLTGPIPPELGNLTNLMYLRLYDNQLTGSIPVELGNTNLHTLDLRNNQLSGEVPLEIWNMEAFYESGAPYGNLRRIYLRHNQFTGVLPEDLCEIDLRWNSYNFIDIRDNSFCPDYPSCLENHMGSQDTSLCDETLGCMDATACNYNPDATVDNGSCAYEVDCSGECGGSAEVDCAGECGGSADVDCADECGGDAVVSSYCEDTDGDGLGNPDSMTSYCSVDVPEGWFLDCSDIEPDCPTNDTDCAGECGGDAVEDMCGICDNDPLNDCVQDDCGEWGGDGNCEINGVPVDWIGHYNIISGGENALCARQTSDGGFILAGSANYQGMLLKTDAEGVLEWSQVYENDGDDDVLKSVLQSSDGGYIATGLSEGPFPDLQYLWVIKTDVSGNIEWEDEHGSANKNDWGEDVLETQDGGFVVTGTQDDDGDNAKAILRKYSSTGSLLWNKTFSSSDYNEGISLMETSDGNLVFVGFSGTSHGAYKHFMVKADADGNQIWKKRFGDNTQQSLNAVCEAPDGNYVAAGYCNNYSNAYIVQRSSSNGSMQWDDCYDDDFESINDIIPSSGGGYYLLDVSSRLIKANNNGEITWGIHLGNANQSLIELDDGDLILGGNQSSIWLFRFDPSAAFIESSVTTTVDEIELDDMGTFEDNFEAFIETALDLPDSTVEVISVTETSSRNPVGIIVDFTITFTEEDWANMDFVSSDDIAAALENVETEIEEDGLEFINGCTDPEATNYDPGATIDDGSCEYMAEIIVSYAGIPAAYALHQNYPNPFNPITNLCYDLPKQAQVTLTVYNLMGKKIAQLVSTKQEAGRRSVQWDATDNFGNPVSAGIYLYQIRAGEFRQTRKMVLLK